MSRRITMLCAGLLVALALGTFLQFSGHSPLHSSSNGSGIQASQVNATTEPTTPLAVSNGVPDG
jgi:hypothetical protein